jgi:hypothetical protein
MALLNRKFSAIAQVQSILHQERITLDASSQRGPGFRPSHYLPQLCELHLPSVRSHCTVSP